MTAIRKQLGDRMRFVFHADVNDEKLERAIGAAGQVAGATEPAAASAGALSY